jgi:hypothetical protein
MEKLNTERKVGNYYRDRNPLNYIVGNEPRALYWYTYRETYNYIHRYLNIGRRISSPLRVEERPNEGIFLSEYLSGNLLDVPIVLVGNNYLKPFDFDIRKRDRSEIGGFQYPGKSATIAFSDNLGETCGGIFDRDCRRQDRMYIATVGEIEKCNYSVYYLPHDNQPLHVRLVHMVHEENPLEHLPPFKDRESIARAFSERKER